MTLTDRERQAVESGKARGCLMCRRIVEAWTPKVIESKCELSDAQRKDLRAAWEDACGKIKPESYIKVIQGDLPPQTLHDWRDEVVTFSVEAQKFHIDCEVRSEDAASRQAEV